MYICIYVKYICIHDYSKPELCVVFRILHIFMIFYNGILGFKGECHKIFFSNYFWAFCVFFFFHPSSVIVETIL